MLRIALYVVSITTSQTDAVRLETNQFEKVTRLTETHDYELPALGGLFAGPLGVLPDLDAVLGSMNRKHNIGQKKGLCHLLNSTGLAQT